jgi:DNA-binding transcriptional ArsR family regulator
MRDSDVLKALSDETRLEILLFLMTGKKNVTQIVERIKKSQPNISIGLKQMTLLGIITQEKKGREAYYSVKNPDTLRKLLENLQELTK